MWVIPKFNAKITKTLEGLKRNGVSLCSKKKKKAAERLPSSGCWGIDAILFWVLGGWIQHADTHTFTYLIDGHYTHTHSLSLFIIILTLNNIMSSRVETSLCQIETFPKFCDTS